MIIFNKNVLDRELQKIIDCGKTIGFVGSTTNSSIELPIGPLSLCDYAKHFVDKVLFNLIVLTDTDKSMNDIYDSIYQIDEYINADILYVDDNIIKNTLPFSNVYRQTYSGTAQNIKIFNDYISKKTNLLGFYHFLPISWYDNSKPYFDVLIQYNPILTTFRGYKEIFYDSVLLNYNGVFDGSPYRTAWTDGLRNYNRRIYLPMAKDIDGTIFYKKNSFENPTDRLVWIRNLAEDITNKIGIDKIKVSDYIECFESNNIDKEEYRIVNIRNFQKATNDYLHKREVILFFRNLNGDYRSLSFWPGFDDDMYFEIPSFKFGKLEKYIPITKDNRFTKLPTDNREIEIKKLFRRRFEEYHGNCK